METVYRRADGTVIETERPSAVPIRWAIYDSKTGICVRAEVRAKTAYEAFQQAALDIPFSHAEFRKLDG